MANVYVNLEAAGSSHAGTELDPLSYSDFVTASATPSTDTFYLRGSIDLNTANFYAPDTSTCKAWDLAAYGPWRVKAADIKSGSTNSYLNAALISDAIIEVSVDPLLVYANITNCYIISPNEINFRNGFLTLGSLINVSTFANEEGAVLTDCCIKADTWSVGDYAPTLNNCAMTGADPSYNLNDCQIDWVAPTLPAWDADQSAFAVSTLFADVDTPPQPGSGSPSYTGYTTDLWGNARTGIGTGYMVTAVPPIWASTYPKAGTIGGTSAEILVQTNETGMAYFVALPGGDTGPSSAQVKDGLNSIGVTGAVGSFGSVAFDADTEASMSATGLTSETNYDLWVVAENDALDLQEFPTGINITTLDITPPLWSPVDPVTLDYGYTGANFTVGINETGTAYFIAVPDGETSPSSTQVKDGVNYAGVTGAEGLIGNILISSGETGTLSATNLEPNTTYDVYFVAEDSSSNLQTSPVSTSVTTQGPPVITVQPSPSSIVEGATASLTVTATGDPAISSYQWYRGVSTPMTDGGRVSGATTNNLQISNAVVADTDTYYVVISNGALPDTTSSTAQLTVSDVVGPVWEDSTPSLTAAHGITADFAVQSSETGNAYFVALPSGADAPSSAEVKAGTGAAGATPIDAGSVAVTSSTPAALTASNLVYSTDYDVYFVAEDTVPNLQASPVLVSVTTLGNIVNLPGSIGIYRFQIAFGTQTFSTNHQQLIIPYTAYGNTALVADLTTYEYSLDGSSWSTMTAAVGTVVTNLDFTPTGEAQTFTWEIKEDITSGIYNKSIYIRFRATSGTMTTAMMSRSFYFPKVVSNEVAARNVSQLPDDYEGINGSDLLRNAPKTGK